MIEESIRIAMGTPLVGRSIGGAKESLVNAREAGFKKHREGWWDENDLKPRS